MVKFWDFLQEGRVFEHPRFLKFKASQSTPCRGRGPTAHNGEMPVRDPRLCPTQGTLKDLTVQVRERLAGYRWVPSAGATHVCGSRSPAITAVASLVPADRGHCFRNRTPGPPPFSSINSTPASSRALRIA